MIHTVKGKSLSIQRGPVSGFESPQHGDRNSGPFYLGGLLRPLSLAQEG
jgi:hypothetical protein